MVDGDAARAARTLDLLGLLAAQLGLRAGDVRVRADAEAGRRTGPRGARGVLADETVWLHPRAYDPGTAPGRGLLAHELTHLAQRDADRRGTARRTDRAAAEAEAARTAADAAAGRPLRPPTVGLPPGPAADVDTDETTLDQLVRDRYARERRAVLDQLDGLWISDEDVTRVLQVLAPLPFGTARALVRTLPTDRRTDLVDNIADPHRRQDRREVLACYAALTDVELSRFDDGLFDEMDVTHVDDLVEQAVLASVARRLPEAAMLRLQRRRPDDARTLMARAVRPDALTREVSAARARERQRAQESDVHAADADLVALHRRLADLLRRPRAEQAHAALEAVRPLVPAPEATDDVPRSPRLGWLVQRLEADGAVERLVDAVPEGDREGAPYGPAFLAVLGHRPVDANLRLVERLLTWSIWRLDLGVSRAEAWLAYQVVRRLPRAERDRWRRRDEGRWLRTLEEHVRGRVGEEGGYAGVGGELALAPEHVPAWRELLAECERGVDATSAPRVLRALGRLAAPGATSGPALRAAVRRLDALGHLDRVLTALPDAVLLGAADRVLLLEVVLARDPAYLLGQVRSLLSTFWPFDGVDPREARLAYELFRALPTADRRALENDGSLAAIVAALPTAVRHDLGLTAFVGTAGGAERRQVLTRLRDAQLWREQPRAAELRAVVRMAVAAGLQREAFDASREQRVDQRPWLATLAEDFGLFDPARRPAFRPAPPSSRADDTSLLGTLVVVLGALYLARGAIALDVPLEDLQDARGGQLGPARLSRGGARDRAAGVNRLRAWWDVTTGSLVVDVPELRLDSLSTIGAGGTLRAGRTVLRRLHAEVRFPDERLERPSHATADLAGLDVDDLLWTAPDTMAGAAATRVHPVHVEVGRPAPDTGAREAAGVPVPILGPLLDLVSTVLVAYAQVGRFDRVQIRDASATIGSVEVDGLAYAGPDVGLGTTVTAASLRVSDVAFGLGMSPAAYERARLAALRRRRDGMRGAAATSPAAAELDRLIAEQQQRVTAREREETELLALERQEAREPGSLTPEQRQRAAALQVGRSGGAALTVGSAELRGLRGETVDVDRLTLRNLRGEGTSPALTRELVSDAERVARFRAHGPPVAQPADQFGRADLTVRASLTASGVRWRGEPPTAAALAYQRAHVPPGDPQGVGPELDRLVAAAQRHEELSARRQQRPLTPTEQADLAAARAVFATTVTQVVVTDAELGVDATTGRLTVAAGRVVASGVDGPSFGAEEVRVEGFHGGLVAALRFATTTADRVAPHTGQFTTGRVAARDLRFGPRGAAGANVVAGLEIVGLRGGVEPVRSAPDQPVTGWRLSNVFATSMTLDDLTYQGAADTTGAALRLATTGRTRVDGITLDATLTSSASAAGTDRVLTVHALHLNQVRAGHVVVDGTGPTGGYHAELIGGVVAGVSVRDLVVPMPAAGEARTTGSVGVEAFDQVRFLAVTGATAAAGSGTRVAGTLGTGQRVGTYTLGIQLLGDGQLYALDALLLSDTEIRTGGNRVTVRRTELSGRVERAGDTTTLTGLTTPEIVVSGLDWAAGGARLRSNGTTRLEQVVVSGSYTATPQSTTATVSTLRIGRIRSDDLHYVDGELDLHLGRFGQRRPDLLDVHEVVVTGLQWEEGAGVTAGSVDVGTPAGQQALRAEFSGALTRRLRVAGGSLEVQTLRLDFRRGGRVVARARGLAGDVGLEERRGEGAAATWDPLAHLSLAARDTGVIDISRGAIEIGGGSQPGLDLGSVTVDQLDIRSPRLTVAVAAGEGAISLANTHARVRVELNDAAAARRSGSPLRRIVVRELFVEEIEADGVAIGLPAQDVTIRLPAGEVGRLRRLRLAPGDAGLVITAPATPGGRWDLAGGLAGSDVLLPRLAAEVRGRFVADVSARFATDEITLDLFSGGGVVLDMTNPTLRAIRAVLDANPGHTLTLSGFNAAVPERYGLSARRVHYDSRTDEGRGRVTASGVAGAGLWYRDEAGGVYVQVESFELPGETTVDATTFAGEIPELSIGRARFVLDLSNAPASTERSTWEQTLDGLRPYFPVINSLQGRITTYVDAGFLLPRVQVDIADGRINYQDLLSQRITGTGGLVYLLRAEVYEDRLLIGVMRLRDPEDPDPQGPDTVPLVSWRLPTDQVEAARREHLVRIVDLLNPSTIGGGGGGSGASPSGGVRLYGLRADLSIRSPDPIPVPVSRPSVTGTVTLSRNALVDLHAEGILPGPGGLHAVGIDQVNVDSTDLVIRGTGVVTAQIQVRGISDTTVLIDRNNQVRRVAGTMRSAVARGIRWNPAGPARPPAPARGGGTP